MGFDAELEDAEFERVANAINDAYCNVLVKKGNVENAAYLMKLRYGVVLMKMSEKDRNEELALLKLFAS